MDKYYCSNCLKDFTQKSHYIAHINKKNSCITPNSLNFGTLNYFYLYNHELV